MSHSSVSSSVSIWFALRVSFPPWLKQNQDRHFEEVPLLWDLPMSSTSVRVTFFRDRRRTRPRWPNWPRREAPCAKLHVNGSQPEAFQLGSQRLSSSEFSNAEGLEEGHLEGLQLSGSSSHNLQMVNSSFCQGPETSKELTEQQSASNRELGPVWKNERRLPSLPMLGSPAGFRRAVSRFHFNLPKLLGIPKQTGANGRRFVVA